MTYRELYEKALDDLEHNKITLGEFDERVKPLNQELTSVIEELEKIKAEIEDKILLNQTVAIQILDNHIAELKGEQDNEDRVN